MLPGGLWAIPTASDLDQCCKGKKNKGGDFAKTTAFGRYGVKTRFSRSVHSGRVSKSSAVIQSSPARLFITMPAAQGDPQGQPQAYSDINVTSTHSAIRYVYLEHREYKN